MFYWCKFKVINNLELYEKKMMKHSTHNVFSSCKAKEKTLNI